MINLILFKIFIDKEEKPINHLNAVFNRRDDFANDPFC